MKFYFKKYPHLSHEEKVALLELRNAPFVRENMYHSKEINLTDHLHWLETLKARTDCLYWAIFLNNELVGGIDLTRIDWPNKFAEWGFFIAEKHLGLGAILEYLGMEYFFETLNLQTILAGVYEKNKKVYHLHKDRFGYQENPSYDSQDGARKFYGLTLSKDVWLKRKAAIYALLAKLYTLNEVFWE